jgi:hypothetical protein
VLKNICGEIMKEVMNFGDENFVIPTKKITTKCSRKNGAKVSKWKISQ